MASTPTEKQLTASWREFQELLEAGASEAQWQKFFAAHPYVLSRSLPLKLLPCDIHPMGRPGRSEPDFLICPGSVDSHPNFGLIELKTPNAKLIRQERKAIFDITADVHTAMRQLQEYDRDFDRFSPKPRGIGFSTRSHQFIIMGSSREIAQLEHSEVFRRQLATLLPKEIQLLTFDELLRNYERECPKPIIVAVPDVKLLRAGDFQFEFQTTPMPRVLFDGYVFRVVRRLSPFEHDTFGAEISQEALDDPAIRQLLGQSRSSRPLLDTGRPIPGVGIITEPFVHTGYSSRFSDGSYGVFYASEIELTAVVEAVRNARQFHDDFNDPVWHAFLSVYRTPLRAELHDLTQVMAHERARGTADEAAVLMELGRQLRAAGSPGVIYPSREGAGRSVAIFSRKVLSHAFHVKTYKADVTPDRTLVEDAE